MSRRKSVAKINLLSKRGRGRQSPSAEAKYQRQQVAAFCDSSGSQLDNPGHHDHNKAYGQDYIRKFGKRKCEANALVVEPEVGLRYVPADAVARYERKLDRVRKQLRKALRERVS